MSQEKKKTNFEVFIVETLVKFCKFCNLSIYFAFEMNDCIIFIPEFKLLST